MSKIKIKNAGQIKNGYARDLALLSLRQDVIILLAETIDLIDCMGEADESLTEKDNACLTRINQILPQSDVYLFAPACATAHDKGAAMLMAKWIQLCFSPSTSEAQFPFLAEAKVLLRDCLESHMSREEN